MVMYFKEKESHFFARKVFTRSTRRGRDLNSIILSDEENSQRDCRSGSHSVIHKQERRLRTAAPKQRDRKMKFLSHVARMNDTL